MLAPSKSGEDMANSANGFPVAILVHGAWA